MRKINKHIIHCSDSAHGDVKTIREWHLARGWSDIGYHFVILQDGTVELGRPLEKQGAHCKGQNAESIGTCLIGKDEFTQEQMLALKSLDNTLSVYFPRITSHPHNEFNKNKTCPNFNIKDIL